MAIDREFAVLEEAIHRMTRDYEAFLFGTGGKLPVESKKKVQDMLRALSNQKIDSQADRYRLNSLTGRFNAESERLERILRDKEEGRGRFSRPGAAGGGPNVPSPASVNPPAAKSPDQELFDRYLQARKSRGEEVNRVSFDKFRELLAGERQKLLARTGRADWEFDLSTEADRVRLVARPAKGKTS